ncbi:MAG: peptidoglycan DD-metalloendopeptidase family protein [Alphaproteobacteria bacterium]|nr:peptidoglycan DD-metalloendopeptidase family protein [Alphaproteobacteria bacterium]
MTTVIGDVAIHKFIKLRHRYVLTRANRLRMRYIVGIFLFSFIFTTLVGAAHQSLAFASAKSAIANFAGNMIAHKIELASYNPVDDRAINRGIVTREAPIKIHTKKDVLSVPVQEPQSSQEKLSEVQVLTGFDLGPQDLTLEIKSGDTLAGILQEAGVGAAEAYRAVKAISKHIDVRSIKAGQVLNVKLDQSPEDESSLELKNLNMKLGATEEVVLRRDEIGRFKSELIEKEVILVPKAAQAVIQSSLYGSAAQSGIPASIIAQMIRIFSYDVDFQRDIREGDKVEILYETYQTEDGDFAHYGNILFANLMVGGKDRPVFRFEDEDGVADYYRENGASLKRLLMKTPIDGARMSSGYGMRKHPVLGYNKMHKGVDFAAPRGTPIYAAGSGVIERANRHGAYGNYIRIRHKNDLKTAYAHLHKFAKGVAAGKRVQQGQIIGYVGTTGRSTGPHLHYEVLQGGSQINPNNIKSATGRKLEGKELESFKSNISKIRNDYALLTRDLKFAQNEATQGE